MKKLSFTFLLTALLSMVGARAIAHNIEMANADGVTIYYNWVNNKTELSVSYRGSSFSSYPDEYSGNVVIPESVTYNGATYPVTSIGERAFFECSSLTSVTIPNSVTDIGENAFRSCSGLKEVSFNATNCTSMGYSYYSMGSPHYPVFENCTSLTTINIGENVQIIPPYAFWGCSGLTSVTIPNSVTSIGSQAFEGCSGLTSIVVESGNSKYDSRENCNAIIETASNTLIAGCMNSFIPNSVTSIGGLAFSVCSSLTSVTIPNSVKRIGEGAFRYCSGLTSVTIPNSVTSIGSDAFSQCYFARENFVNNSTLSSDNYWGATLYDKETEDGLLINNNSVVKCRKWATSVSIPNGVTSIGNYAFSGCSGLTSVTIPNSVTTIGRSAFTNCTKLASVNIPDGVTSIPDGSLLPNEGVFLGCRSLTSITIPNSVTSIGGSAFRGCSGLTSVKIGNSVTSIGGFAFSGCSSLTSVTIPNSVKRIGESAFSGCSGLTSVTIPNSVTSIDMNAFSGCSSLKTIVLPVSLEKIGNGAFSGLKSLEDLYCYARASPQLGNNIFENSPIGFATLHVPERTIEGYEKTSPWSAFMKIVPLTDSDPDPSGGDLPGGGEGDEQCAKPTISYNKGKLNFYSATEGALCHYTISDSDIASSYGNEVQLSVTYNISVYATKSGYENSETATATLCWIDVEPSTEGISDGTSGAKEIEATPVLIQSENGRISVSGAGDGSAISVFGTNGVKVGAAVSHSGQAVINTNLSSGSVAVVKIGEKSVKVAVK